ncbi:sensor histidine kinase [Mucilaginibacter sp. HD30]
MNKKIIRSTIIHMLAWWVILNINFVLPYVYRVHLHGNYLWKADGTATTAWEYFLLLNYYPSNVYYLICKLFLFVPLVEITWWFLFRRNLMRSAILSCFAIGILIAVIHHIPWNRDRFNNEPFSIIQATLVFACYALAYGFVRKALHERALSKEMKLQRSENELNALKSQLNPHFFFNSLNYLYGTALDEKAGKTAEIVNMISEMMRYTIAGMRNNFVLLTDELKFVNNYLSLQRARLPQKDSINIKTYVTAYNGNYQIAPLILLPFIENAFKYGISIDHPCFIDLTIDIRDGYLTMSIKNRIITEHVDVGGNNTGIVNTRKRLELLYENNYSLRHEDPGEIYKVELSVKLI